VGMIERQGRVKAKVVKKEGLTIKKLTSLVRRNVDISNATLITDEFSGYMGLQRIMPFKTVNHKVWYVNGEAHTNTIESFWAILKRAIVGQYHKVTSDICLNTLMNSATALTIGTMMTSLVRRFIEQ